MKEKLAILRKNIKAEFWLVVFDDCEVIYSEVCTLSPQSALVVANLGLTIDTYMRGYGSPCLRFFDNQKYLWNTK